MRWSSLGYSSRSNWKNLRPDQPLFARFDSRRLGDNTVKVPSCGLNKDKSRQTVHIKKEEEAI